MTARVSVLLKSRASPDMLPFSLCNKKRLAIRHINGPPLSNDTIDSVLRHREVGRANELPPPHHSLGVSQQFKILVFCVTHHLEVLVNIGILEQCAASVFKVEMG